MSDTDLTQSLEDCHGDANVRIDFPPDALDVLEAMYASESELTDEELNALEQSTSMKIVAANAAAIDAVSALFNPPPKPAA